ncbi:hypothetical protein MPER_14992 [Moniliophthora perniciosa FA553]|nr:hypothetical protein MPER_14992 [Moniliophthora perniciosa FA553]
MLDEEATSTALVSDARNWGPPCIQRPAVVGVGVEDCLTLNIWKPTNASEGDKLPVAVYIHGGGFYANVSCSVHLLVPDIQVPTLCSLLKDFLSTNG